MVFDLIRSDIIFFKYFLDFFRSFFVRKKLCGLKKIYHIVYAKYNNVSKTLMEIAGRTIDGNDTFNLEEIEHEPESSVLSRISSVVAFLIKE